MPNDGVAKRHDRLADKVIISPPEPTLLKSRGGVGVADIHPNFEKDLLHGQCGGPSRVGEQLGADGAAGEDVASAAGSKGDEFRADDADKGRRHGERGAEADFEDDALAAETFHVLREGQGLVEAVKFDDPLKDVVDLFKVDVPTELAKILPRLHLL